MAKAAGLKSVNKTNHSARKTGIKKLLHADIPPTDVMQISGHKNVQSLNSYSVISNEQQKNLSRILTVDNSSSKENNPLLTDNEQLDAVLVEQLLNDDFSIETSGCVFSAKSCPTSSESKSSKRSMPIEYRGENKDILHFLNGTINGNVEIQITVNNNGDAKRSRLEE